MIQKHQRRNNKSRWNEDGLGWKRSTRIANHQLEKFRLIFSRSSNRDVAPLLGLEQLSTGLLSVCFTSQGFAPCTVPSHPC